MAPCGYLTTTISGRIVKVNKTLIEWTGYDREALTGGSRFVDLLTVGGRIFFETHINLLLRVQSAVDEIALDMVCKNGTVLPVLINGRQKRDAAGEPVVNRFTIFNASERRMYERNILAARDLLHVTLASIGDAVVTTDEKARITFMNSVAEELTGWKTESAQGKPIDEVLILVRESGSVNVENPLIHALSAGTTAGVDDTVLISREGRRIPVDHSASAIRDANNSIVGGVLVFRDISERKRNEALERENRERIRETARLESLGQMAAGIAHDFNNLLTGILGNASLLTESVADTDLPKAHDILNSAERAASLTNQILAYSGNSWLEKKSVDLNLLVRESAPLIRPSIRSQIELELVNADLTLEADPGQIRQIIVNLAINASEATPDGKGVVFIRTDIIEHLPSRFSPLVHAAIDSGTYALLEVRDNGTGISKDAQKRMFDPFFTTKFTGRGLGLSAVLGIVKAHHGDIEVLSEVGKGSTFRIILPVTTRAPQVFTRSPQPSGLVVPTNQTVLVVDDEEVIRKLASIALKSHGMRPLVAVDGSQALAILRAEPTVSLVILDLTMPVMSGDEALPRIKEMRPDLPVIISSGFSETEILRRFESAGIASVISKPYTIPVFVSKVVNALQAHNPSGANGSPGKIV